MSGAPDVLKQITDALSPFGLAVRGVLDFDDGEGPLLADGGTAKAVVLIGHVGSSFWGAFAAWRGGPEDPGGCDPLDRWSKAVVTPIAARFLATAYFPSDPPYQPFQRWAMAAKGLCASPLGILIDPEAGLWHGFRAALGIETPFGLGRAAKNDICAGCRDTPCIAACPAGAVRPSGFAPAPCRSYLATSEGRSHCLSSGCIARDACPVGRTYRYQQEQVRFHMAALRLE